MPELTPRLQAADTFLRSGKCVCPFARFCVMHYGEVSARPRWDRKILLKLAKEFARTGWNGATPDHALVLVAPDWLGVRGNTEQPYQEAKTWATETFLELTTACIQVSAPDATLPEVEEAVRQIRRVLLDDADPRRPAVAINGAALMTICLAPVYPEAHPRYAPLTLLAATWQSDIARAQKSSNLIEPIRARMKAEHGVVYDANDLMLPLPGGGP